MLLLSPTRQGNIRFKGANPLDDRFWQSLPRQVFWQGMMLPAKTNQFYDNSTLPHADASKLVTRQVARKLYRYPRVLDVVTPSEIARVQPSRWGHFPDKLDRNA